MLMQQPLFCDILRLFKGIGLVIKCLFLRIINYSETENFT